MKLSKFLSALALTTFLSVGSALTLQAEGKACDPAKVCQKSGKSEKSCCMGKKGKCILCKLIKKLDLTEEQQQKGKAIKESKKSEFDKIRATAKKKSQAVMDDMEKEFRKILTPEQTAKLDAMKSEKGSEKKAE